jgi:hypothetical protein
MAPRHLLGGVLAVSCFPPMAAQDSKHQLADANCDMHLVCGRVFTLLVELPKDDSSIRKNHEQYSYSLF